MEIVKPFFDTELSGNIELELNQLNPLNIRISLKTNTKKRYLKKCNSNGYVDEIYNVSLDNNLSSLNTGNGVISAENLSGKPKFNVIYSCRLYLPVIGSYILAQISKINQALILSHHNSISILILTQDINTNNFIINDKNELNDKKTNLKLNINSHVVIRILNRTFGLNDTDIKVMGYLESLATTEEIKNGYFHQIEEKEDNFLF